MNTTIAACEVYSCHFNYKSLCVRDFITLDEAAKCDYLATQEPLPEPPGPNNEPSFIGPVED